MKKTFFVRIIFLLFCLMLYCSSSSSLAQSFTDVSLKPRIIVLTDLKRVQETDDAASLVRLLSLADLVEIEGIIVSSGFNYWKPSHILEGYEFVWEMLDSYGLSVVNMMKMNGQRTFDIVETTQKIGYWPSVNYLKQRTAIGTAMMGMGNVGNNFSNDGSRLIANIVDENDQRPIYVLVWGGGNVLAQTLWDISQNSLKKRSPEGIAAFIKKLRVISIGDQDMSWNDRNKPLDEKNSHFWMRQHFPELFWVMVSPGNFMKRSDEMQSFYQLHIQGHGALGNMYPDHSNSVEGDSPSLFFVLPLGIGNPEYPDWGNLAGIFVRAPHPKEKNSIVWTESNPGQDDFRKISQDFTSRWIQFMWNLFAVRLDWARSGTGNRMPVAVVNGDASQNVLELTSGAGSSIEVDASGSFDNESDDLKFHWSIVPVSFGYKGNVIIENSAEARINIKIPIDATGKEIHILLELMDDGAGHPLTAFRRIILKVK